MSYRRSISCDRAPLLAIVDRIRRSGKITLDDRKKFNAAFNSMDLLSVDEQAAVRDTIDRLARGWLQVVD
ncbi:MAG: hypothetical protein SW833_11665 [Cyanobacteriota bacterium]|nr:hypothetical protein [Cyanobacteriota bacterium]